MNNYFSRIYTAVTAEELSAGDLVYVADRLATLRAYVDNDSNIIYTIKCIDSDKEPNRFVVYATDKEKEPWNISSWNLACLVSTADNVEAYDYWQKIKDDSLIAKHETGLEVSSKYFPGQWADINRAPEFWNINKLYRIKQQGRFRPYRHTSELIEAWKGKETCVHSDLVLPIIWVKSKNTPTSLNIAGIKDNSVLINKTWVCLEVLFSTYTFLDGSSCGVEY